MSAASKKRSVDARSPAGHAVPDADAAGNGLALEDVGDCFRLIILSGPQLRGKGRGKAGQKLRVAIGAGLSTRNYTPIDWDEAGGHARHLAFAQGEGLGAAWVRGAAVGDRSDVFGPPASRNLGGARGPIRVFGDETSIGLARAL